jgi:hypothetical protein
MYVQKMKIEVAPVGEPPKMEPAFCGMVGEKVPVADFAAGLALSAKLAAENGGSFGVCVMNRRGRYDLAAANGVALIYGGAL